MVVFGKKKAVNFQVKSSETPASKDCVIIDGSPWTESQLNASGSIFNKHNKEQHFEATLILLLDRVKDGTTNFYLAPPEELEVLARKRGLAYANLPKRDGTPRSINFRKELPREEIATWLNAWHLLD